MDVPLPGTSSPVLSPVAGAAVVDDGLTVEWSASCSWVTR
jgi:hypothetical protein